VGIAQEQAESETVAEVVADDPSPVVEKASKKAKRQRAAGGDAQKAQTQQTKEPAGAQVGPSFKYRVIKQNQ
jgi:hypothetical protein